ncbi:MAG: NUDIX domain-containing protein [Vicinamibacterales bacterium]
MTERARLAPRTPLTHAGGVVVRERDGRAECLLVRALPPPHDWVLPKGHIDPGERPEACARREVAEEAGVDAVVQRLLGYDTYVTPQGKHVSAVFFLMRYSGEVESLEQRECQWVTLEGALDALPFTGARELVRAAFG